MQRRIDQVRTATERLRDLRREREDVLRFLSHDIRSPLSSLVALARLQRDPATRLPVEELAAQTESLARRASLLAEGFVELARAEAHDPARFSELDLVDPVHDAADEVWAAARAKDIEIETTVKISPAPVRGDRQLLARAIANLLNNSVKYAPAGSSVRMTVARVEGGFTIAVADRGPGIPAAELERIFQRYSRINEDRGTDPGGIGLGLAFVRAVAKKHSGRVSVESEVWAGATFSLWLPCSPDGGRGANAST